MTPREPRPASAVAPGRVNLIGEHVDYHGGRCLPFALRQATTTHLRPRSDGLLRVRSADRSWQGTAEELDGSPTWVRYVAGVFAVLGVRTGFDVVVDGGVPLGAGLSSSAALECSVAVALDASLGLGLDASTLVEACVRTENEVVGAPTGGMDQTVSLHAREGHALLLDFTTGAREQVPFEPAAAGLDLLVIDTGVRHDLADGAYAARRREATEAARRLGVARLPEVDLARLPSPREPAGTYLRRARHVVTEVRRVDDTVTALHTGDWAAVGALLDASHASLREDYEVSCDELDVACDAARSAGALGARMTGGGFGGSAIALVPRTGRPAVRESVRGAFASRGWDAPAFLDAEPGPGARAMV